MSKQWYLGLAGGLVLGIALSGTALNSALADGQDYMSPDAMAQAMEKWMKTTQPGAGHKRLDKFVGNWKTKFTAYWGPMPSVTTGTSRIEWMLDGRYTRETYKGTLMMPSPDGTMTERPFEGMGITGYDNYRNTYVTFWADSVGTAPGILRGTYNPQTRIHSYYGEMDEPMLDMVGRTVHGRIEWTGENTWKFEMIDLAVGPDHVSFRIEYERQ